MDILRWRKSYETGIPSMDEQHKQLIDLVNTMYRVVRGSEDFSTVEKVLKELEKYAEVHFHQEEALLKEHSFPDYDTHLELHNQYKEKVAQLVADMRGGNGTKKRVDQQLYTFLRSWWIEHISQEDKMYGPFLKEKGCI